MEIWSNTTFNGVGWTMNNFDFSFIIEKATIEQVERINDAFLKAVEKEGLFCGGGYKPVEDVE